MEHNDPTRRSYVPHSYASQASPQGGGQQQQQQHSQQHPSSSHHATPPSMGHMRPPYVQSTPTSLPSSVGRPGSQTQPVYGFGGQYDTGSAMQSNPMAYTPGMQPPDSQRQQPGSQYSSYPSAMMTSMTQAQQGPSTPSHYDPIDHYRGRMNAPEPMSSPFAMGGQQYYLQSQPAPPGAQTAELASSHMPNQFAQQQYVQPGAPSSSYDTSMIDASPGSVYTPYGQPSQYSQPDPQPQQQQQQQPSQQPQQSIAEAPQQPDQAAFDNYRHQIQTIFTLARDESLHDISGLLLQASHFLIGNAEALGLTRDDESQHNVRIRLWDELNNAWLATLQRQFDLTSEMLSNGRPLRDPRSIMTFQTLNHLSSQLRALADLLEPFGLVDYQMGFAEDEISEILMRCLNLLWPAEEQQQAQSEADPPGGPSNRGAGR